MGFLTWVNLDIGVLHSSKYRYLGGSNSIYGLIILQQITMACIGKGDKEGTLAPSVSRGSCFLPAHMRLPGVSYKARSLEMQ